MKPVSRPLVPFLLQLGSCWLGCAVLAAAPQFEVTLPATLATNPLTGRLLLVIAKTDQPEPRLRVSDADFGSPLVFGRDADKFAPGSTLTFDDTSTTRLGPKLSQIPPGRYYVQAVLNVSTELQIPDAAGNLVGDTREITLDADTQSPVKIELTRRLPVRERTETEYVKFVTIPSRLLSDFHKRPMNLRAGVILPRTHANEPQRRYPLWVRIGGYGARYMQVAGMMNERSGFRRDWLATNAPQMILVLLDGAGPFGDPYQVNSANNGPWGDAVTQELIPHIEKQFRGMSEGRARVLEGTSTGGWVSLALQIFYPDFFNGAWAFAPDGVDLRAFELIDIYKDDNAFVNRFGEERPAMRDNNGDVRFTVRREVQMEEVLGRGGSWTLSGQQWGAWNAVYGPRGADGLPVPVWDTAGNINHEVAEKWKPYDLRLVLEENWATLAPQLRGKLHIWVGDADNYFLNNAVHLMERALLQREPKDVATFTYGPGKGHDWSPLTTRELMEQFRKAIGRSE